MRARKQRQACGVCIFMTVLAAATSARTERYALWSQRYPPNVLWRGGSQLPMEQPPPPPPRHSNQKQITKERPSNENEPVQQKSLLIGRRNLIVPPPPRHQPPLEQTSQKQLKPEPPRFPPPQHDRVSRHTIGTASSERPPPPPPKFRARQAGWIPPPPKSKSPSESTEIELPSLHEDEKASEQKATWEPPRTGIPPSETSLPRTTEEPVVGSPLDGAEGKTESASAPCVSVRMSDPSLDGTAVESVHVQEPLVNPHTTEMNHAPNAPSTSSNVVSAPTSDDGNNDERDVSASTAESFDVKYDRPTDSADVFIMVPPGEQDELDRISLKTGLSRKQQVRDSSLKGNPFERVLQLRQRLAIEKLLISQESIHEQMEAITGLLRELLARERRSDSLVVHVPRQLAQVPPRIIRRRVEKVRKVPRQTILSSVDDLNRDLSDGEFDQLLRGLEQPSEVDEIYHEYEYDEEYPWKDDISHATHMTPNFEEVNAFLRESSDTESWQSAGEQNEDEQNEDEFDHELYYDEYYDEELLNANELSVGLDESGTDAAVGELTEEGSMGSDIGRVLETDDPGTVAADEATKAEDPVMSIVSDPSSVAPRRPQEGRNMHETDVRSRKAANDTQEPPPPPPPRLHRHRRQVSSSKEQRDDTWRPPVPPTLPTRTISAQRASGELPEKRPPPPPRPPPRPGKLSDSTFAGLQKPDVDLVETVDDVSSEDESEHFDEDERRLLEESAVEVDRAVWIEADEIEFSDDFMDEDDVRILHLSRWMPSPNRKRQSLSDADDLIVDEALYLDEQIEEADVATDDFTDIEDTSPLPEPPLAVVDEESSEEEMTLGESAVTVMRSSSLNAPLPKQGNARSGLLPPPPPPRPPPRPSNENDLPNKYQTLQGSHVSMSPVRPQHTSRGPYDSRYQESAQLSQQHQHLRNPRFTQAESHFQHQPSYEYAVPNTNQPYHAVQGTPHPPNEPQSSQYNQKR